VQHNGVLGPALSFHHDIKASRRGVPDGRRCPRDDSYSYYTIDWNEWRAQQNKLEIVISIEMHLLDPAKRKADD
jgi:hypothetical protein